MGLLGCEGVVGIGNGIGETFGRKCTLEGENGSYIAFISGRNS